MSTNGFNTPLTKATNNLARFKDEATKKEAVELQGITKTALVVLRGHQAAEKLSGADLFKKISSSGSSIQVADFQKFFAARRGDKADDGKEETEPLAEEDVTRA